MRIERRGTTGLLCLIVGLIALLSTSSCFAQTEDGGTEGLFSFGTGAEAIALGGANTARPEYYSAVYWNPAFLDEVPSMQVGFFHTSFLGETPYDFASFTYPTLRIGTFGAGVFRIATGGIQGYDDYGVPGESFSFSQEEFLMGYGKRLAGRSAAGALLKIDHQSMFGRTATGIGLDLGLSYALPADYLYLRSFPYLSTLRAGLVARNLISPALKLGSVSNTFPRSLVLGISQELSLSSSHVITPTVDLEKMQNHDLRIRFGIEYGYIPYLAFRGGVNSDSKSFGIGIDVKQGLGFDYAMRNTDIQTQHMFSVDYSFGLSREEKLRLESKREEEKIQKEIQENFEKRRAQEVKKHSEKARLHLGAKDYFAALNEWQQVLAWDENNAPARNAVQDITTILDNLQEERNIDAETKAASKELFEVGIRYYTEKRYPEAISSWERVLEIDPEHTVSQEYLEKAKEEVRRLVHQHTERALRLVKAGDYTGALNEYHVALRYDPQNLASLTGISRTQDLMRSNESFREGLTSYIKKDYESAARAFSKALELNPRSPMVKDYLAEVESRLKGDEGGVQPELEKDYLAGVDLYLQGKYDEAIVIWKKLLEVDPHNQRVLRNIQAAQERLKTIEEFGRKTQ